MKQAKMAVNGILLLLGAVLLTIALSKLPFMKGLEEQGWIVYIESCVFLVGFVSLLRDNEKWANTSMELLQTLGFLGTMMGFIVFLGTWGDGAKQDISGIKLAFLTTGQALLLNAILLVLSLGKAKSDKEEA